jgi:Icc-related predicted phosphoesterase
MNGNTIHIAAMGDLHCRSNFVGKFRPLFLDISDNADILLLCGDLVDYGLPDEADVLVKELNEVIKRIPVIAVLGNHEFESGKVDDVRKILTDAGIILLDGDACEVKGIGFAGVKGFAGGFGERMLAPWGEDIIKHFVREAVDEALKLESALAKLRTSHRIAVLHYSPIAATVMGEPMEIYPFLGSSRLEEPLNRFSVTAAFHGHAHHGAPEGKTKTGVPVYNVAMKLLEHTFHGQLPYRILNLPRAEEAGK